MGQINRRSIMRAFPFVAAIGAAPIIFDQAVKHADAAPPQGFDHHLAGLQAAAQALNPEITAWGVTSGRWGFGTSFMLIGASDEGLTDGTSIGGCLPIGMFNHNRLGPVPEFQMPDYRGPDQRYAAMTTRENAYRRWLGLPEVRI